jgi:hypothetical protein
MLSLNKTGEWLSSLTENERDKFLQQARSEGPKLRQLYKERTMEIETTRQDLLRDLFNGSGDFNEMSINDNKLFFNFSTECSFPFSLNINRLLSAICSRITFLNLSCAFNAPFFQNPAVYVYKLTEDYKNEDLEIFPEHTEVTAELFCYFCSFI